MWIFKFFIFIHTVAAIMSFKMHIGYSATLKGVGRGQGFKHKKEEENLLVRFKEGKPHWCFHVSD